MEHFFYDDTFCSDLEDLANVFDIDEDNVNELKDDWQVRVESSDLEPIFNIDADTPATRDRGFKINPINIDSINTYDTTGIKSVNGKRPYEYLVNFDNGIYFHKALASLESFGAYDVTYVDEQLNILFTSSTTYSNCF